MWLGKRGVAHEGHMWAMALLLSSLLSTISIHQLYVQSAKIGVQVRAALTGMIYRKSLRIARSVGGAGHVINMVSSDVNRVVQACTEFHYFWSAFTETAVILGLIGYEARAACVPVYVLVVLLLPAQYYLGRKTLEFQEANAAVSTERIHLMSEVLTAIKLIKFYAWERPFSERIDAIRAKEVEYLRKGMYVKSINFAIVFSIPVLAAVTCLSMYNGIYGRPDATKVFVILSVLNTLRYPFLNLPLAVRSTTGAQISLARLNTYFKSVELQPIPKTPSPPHDPRVAFSIQAGVFQWEGTEKPAVSNVNIEARRGEIIAVIGDVGSGKSSLLGAILGQCTLKSGSIAIHGSTSYVPQEAWILGSMTLRDNILFGSAMDRARYREIIRVAGLQRDLTLLVAGDKTEMAERGANLSGGQKHRVSLARAVYSNSDIILLDSPLAALDAKVGRHIFEECFLSNLRNQGQKAVVLVTHQLQYLSQVDKIIVMKAGQIVQYGTYDELCQDAGFTKMIEKHVSAQTEDAAPEDDGIMDSDEDDENMVRNNLIKEDRSTEDVGFVNYVHWAAAGKGVTATVLIVIFFFLVHGVRIASDYWLRLWVPNTLNKPDSLYLGVYGGFIVIFGLGAAARGFLFSNEAALKTEMLHQQMFRRVMRAPQGFFDTTPLARLLAAFSKHQTTIDDTTPDLLLQALQYVPLSLGAMIIIACIVPYNYGPVIGIAILAVLLVMYGGPAEKKAKQIEAITKPPLMSHLTSTLEGLFSIRAYEAQIRFDDMNLERLDTNDEALFTMALVKSWLAFNIDIVTCVLIYLTAMLIVIRRFHMDQVASNAGLALSNALQMLVFLQWAVRMLGDVNAQMSSVGQLHYYGSDAVPQEAPAEIPETKPPADWPSKGVIEYRDVSLRYQPDGVDVLKKVSFHVGAHEKIGLVGRTGSGKSTLLIALLRIVELHSGQIILDGIDLATIGLNDLRRNIAIVPQESVLFVGTIRSNVDPFHKCTDDEIWRALDAVQLGEMIRSQPQKLDSPVVENGMNFSLGQRQLFCMARAILSKARILVLDEASSALTLEFDELILETIKQNFADVTVVTVAHRLLSIAGGNAVLVMEGGVAREYDEPIRLLDNPNGDFSQLVANTGPAAARKIREHCQLAHDEREAAKAAGL
ncbi:hypothetical protein CXG81DRAFT_14602 [Caulochytrium protostelioides]|uniref:P-loop containing nucleoside triphosphate hydrolase protein n=1 Tax=Caulochytrium protostelioides TaxID=1555241 RepID=A0A4P9X2Z0_9FUNG|nr:hypothetical protein CXG81DRAFT_14602 [Caulochytrium protostelioides]|eukprot:RKO99373.1 hypothetical protein CXG81DRAFT_14602 [Caulochytrium protostelioides]